MILLTFNELILVRPHRNMSEKEKLKITSPLSDNVGLHNTSIKK